jgi:hypothetical protein
MKTAGLKYILPVAFCLLAATGFAVNIPRGFSGDVFLAKSAIIEKDFAKARRHADAAARNARKPEQSLEARFLDAAVEAGTADYAKAVQKLEAISADHALSAENRFKAFALARSLEAVQGKTAPDMRPIREQAEKLRAAPLPPAAEYTALNDAAAILIGLGEEAAAKTLIGLADSLHQTPTKTYLCRYVENAPPGAGGWFGSKLLKDPAALETRFEGYNRQSAAMLFADITAGREASAAGDTRQDYYAANTAFQMVYDSEGWHIFFLLGEAGLADRLADDKSLGSLEVFFTPGTGGESYYQWITQLPSGKTNVFDWNSAHRHYRYLGDSLKSETAAVGDRIGSYIFIPWEALYDKLPLDGKPWRFSVIRWSPGGGFTWGGKVHETGAWGQIEWQAPGSEEWSKIKRRIVRRAWAKYSKARQELTTFWTDEEIGDLDFYNNRLKAAIGRLDAPEKQLAEADKLTAAQIDELFTRYVPDWMEFGRLAAGLRREHLNDRLMPSR